MDFSLETRNKPLCTLSSFSYIPPRRNDMKETSYFSRDSKVTDVSTYDRVFHQAEGFDMRLPRDDRRHWKGVGLNINKEEKSRSVPVLSSSEYGRRSAPEHYRAVQPNARCSSLKADIYRKSGIIWNVEEGYGSVVPN